MPGGCRPLSWRRDFEVERWRTGRLELCRLPPPSPRRSEVYGRGSLSLTPVSSFEATGCFLSLGAESPLPTVAAVWLEYPESLEPSTLPFFVCSSGLDRLAATLATLRVSGRVVLASSSKSSQKAAGGGGRGGLEDMSCPTSSDGVVWGATDRTTAHD